MADPVLPTNPVYANADAYMAAVREPYPLGNENTYWNAVKEDEPELERIFFCLHSHRKMATEYPSWLVMGEATDGNATQESAYLNIASAFRYLGEKLRKFNFETCSMGDIYFIDMKMERYPRQMFTDWSEICEDLTRWDQTEVAERPRWLMENGRTKEEMNRLFERRQRHMDEMVRRWKGVWTALTRPGSPDAMKNRKQYEDIRKQLEVIRAQEKMQVENERWGKVGECIKYYANKHRGNPLQKEDVSLGHYYKMPFRGDEKAGGYGHKYVTGFDARLIIDSVDD